MNTPDKDADSQAIQTIHGPRQRLARGWYRRDRVQRGGKDIGTISVRSENGRLSCFTRDMDGKSVLGVDYDFLARRAGGRPHTGRVGLGASYRVNGDVGLPTASGQEVLPSGMLVEVAGENGSMVDLSIGAGALLRTARETVEQCLGFGFLVELGQAA